MDDVPYSSRYTRAISSVLDSINVTCLNMWLFALFASIPSVNNHTFYSILKQNLYVVRCTPSRVEAALLLAIMLTNFSHPQSDAGLRVVLANGEN